MAPNLLALFAFVVPLAIGFGPCFLLLFAKFAGFSKSILQMYHLCVLTLLARTGQCLRCAFSVVAFSSVFSFQTEWSEGEVERVSTTVLSSIACCDHFFCFLLFIFCCFSISSISISSRSANSFTRA